jgi:hypothetical protein
MLADVLTLKQELISILRQLANPGDDPSKAFGQSPRKAVLIGRSLGCDLQQLHCSAGAASDPERRCVVNALTNGLGRRDTHTCRTCSPGLGNESYR